jgi:hypothetical protein
MQRAESVHGHLDGGQHVIRTVLTAVLVILSAGILLGWVVGMALTEAFDATGLQEMISREFSVPAAPPETVADNLRP